MPVTRDENKRTVRSISEIRTGEREGASGQEWEVIHGGVWFLLGEVTCEPQIGDLDMAPFVEKDVGGL